MRVSSRPFRGARPLPRDRYVPGHDERHPQAEGVEAIETFVHDVKSRGYQGIALAGASDLDFIVEHACEICGVRYLRDDAATKAATRGSDELFLEKRTRPSAAFLQVVVSQGAGGRRGGVRFVLFRSSSRRSLMSLAQLGTCFEARRMPLWSS